MGRSMLAWDAVLEGGRNPRDGLNVVLHEFAHQLDYLDGVADGTPPLRKKGRLRAVAGGDDPRVRAAEGRCRTRPPRVLDELRRHRPRRVLRRRHRGVLRETAADVYPPPRTLCGSERVLWAGPGRARPECSRREPQTPSRQPHGSPGGRAFGDCPRVALVGPILGDSPRRCARARHFGRSKTTTFMLLHS